MGTTTIENIGDELVQRGADRAAATDLATAFELVKAWIEQVAFTPSIYRTCELYRMDDVWVVQLCQWDGSRRDNDIFSDSSDSLTEAICCAWMKAHRRKTKK